MKLYTVIINGGDGSCYTNYFRTFDEAQAFVDYNEERGEYDMSDGVQPIDTDARGFFTEESDYKDDLS